MPGVSGLELLEQFGREEVPLPVIVMSAYGDVPTVVRAMKAGALDFLEKPCRDQQLWEAIQEALRWESRHRQQFALRANVRQTLAAVDPRRTRRPPPGDRRLGEPGDGQPPEAERADDRSPPGQADEENESPIRGRIGPPDDAGRV